MNFKQISIPTSVKLIPCLWYFNCQTQASLSYILSQNRRNYQISVNETTTKRSFWCAYSRSYFFIFIRMDINHCIVLIIILYATKISNERKQIVIHSHTLLVILMFIFEFFAFLRAEQTLPNHRHYSFVIYASLISWFCASFYCAVVVLMLLQNQKHA